MISSKIVGVGSYLPEKVLTNTDLEKFLDTSDAWIYQRTGIKKRHIADKQQNTSDLATIAVERALQNACINANDLDALILATTTPDFIFPATSVRVQHNIQMKSGFAFDIQAACSGFIYALQLGDSLIKSKKAKKVAIIGAETMSRIVNWHDRSTSILFGDGAGSVIIEETSPNDPMGIIDIELFSDGSLQDILSVEGGLPTSNTKKTITMNGREVFKHAVNKIADSIQSLVYKNGLNIQNLDWVLLHQANERIIKSVMKKINLSIEKGVSTVGCHANTSAASIPLALDNYISCGKIKPRDLVVFAAVGSGLTWGSVLLKI